MTDSDSENGSGDESERKVTSLDNKFSSVAKRLNAFQTLYFVISKYFLPIASNF